MGPPEDRRRRFEEIYASCHGPVLAYVLRRTGNGDDAADVLAETFLTAWRRLDDVPHGRQTQPWLYAWRGGRWPTTIAASGAAPR